MPGHYHCDSDSDSDSVIHLAITIHLTITRKRLFYDRKTYDGMPSERAFYDHCFPNKKVGFPEKYADKDNYAERMLKMN